MDVDLTDRFEIVVDPDAEPVDLDEALAEFLLSYVRSERGSSEQGAEGLDDLDGPNTPGPSPK